MQLEIGEDRETDGSNGHGTAVTLLPIHNGCLLAGGLMPLKLARIERNDGCTKLHLR